MMTKSRWIGAAVLPVLLAHCDDDDLPCRRAAGDDDEEPPLAFESADAFTRHLGALHGQGGDAFGLSRMAGLPDSRTVLC